MSSNINGGLLEGQYDFQDSAIEYILSIGFGPGLDDQALNPFDILHPGVSSHKLGGGVRLSYLPDTLEESKYGVFAGYSQMPTSIPGLEQFNQIQSGLFANWRIPSRRILGAFYNVYNDMEIN